MKKTALVAIVFALGLAAGLLYKPYQMMVLGELRYVVYNRITGEVVWTGISKSMSSPFVTKPTKIK